MRYRALDVDGDMTWGRGSLDYLTDTPAAVAQAVMTRLRLFTGEWFLDRTDGMPWQSQVLGSNTTAVYDAAIQERILDTQGVVELTAYSSSLNRDGRALSVAATISTVYGQTVLETVL